MVEVDHSFKYGQLTGAALFNGLTDETCPKQRRDVSLLIYIDIFTLCMLINDIYSVDKGTTGRGYLWRMGNPTSGQGFKAN